MNGVPLPIPPHDDRRIHAEQQGGAKRRAQSIRVGNAEPAKPAPFDQRDIGLAAVDARGDILLRESKGQPNGSQSCAERHEAVETRHPL